MCCGFSMAICELRNTRPIPVFTRSILLTICNSSYISYKYFLYFIFHYETGRNVVIMLSKPTRNWKTKFHEKFNSLNRKMISIRQLEYQYFCVFSDRLEYINAFAKYRKYDGIATRTRQIRYHHGENSNLGPNKLHTPIHTPKSNLVPRARTQASFKFI